MSGSFLQGVDIGHTFRSIILIHAIEGAALDHSSLAHFLTHGDDQVECCITSLFRWLFGSKDSFRDNGEKKVQVRRRDERYKPCEQVESILRISSHYRS